MRKFILVDHSLRDTGGHHYPYAASVLQAAEAAGFAPALATHRDFRITTAFPSHWPLHALFPAVSYSAHTLDTQAKLPPARSMLGRFMTPLREAWRRRQRHQHIEQFAAACHELFRRLPLAEGDVVFLPTASELDLHGLAAYLSTAPTIPGVQWHAQLHFGIHRDRQWRRHGDSAAVAAMRSSLQSSLAGCKPRPLHLWCTTEPLADQYQALGVAEFRALPYPVHPYFSEFRQRRPQPLPARIACLGHARREKNQQALPALLQQLWADAFAPGRAQLVVQNARPRLRATLQAGVQQLSATMPLAAGALPFDCSTGKLDQAQYARLVCDSDIALLLYDARRYHDRCSGVLLEMLVAGVPVVVPARSWLSDQIAASNQSWLLEAAQTLKAAGRLQGLAQSGAATLPMPEGASGVLLTAEFPPQAAEGYQIELIRHQANGEVIGRQTVWLEPPRGQQQCRRLIPLPPDCHSLTLKSDAGLTIEAISGPLPPLGALGVAIDDAAEAAIALRDILDHIEHYKGWSARNAVRAAADSSAARIVERLLERGSASVSRDATR